MTEIIKRYKTFFMFFCLTTSACAKITWNLDSDSKTATEDAGTDTGADTDTDTDTDTNTDTNTDSETETDTGADTDTDTNTDTDTDTNTDTETDTNTDTDTDTNTETETETDTDSETETDTGTGESLPDLSVLFSHTDIASDTDPDTGDTEPLTLPWYNMGIQIHSDDTEAVPLSGMILRYYYTIDHEDQPQILRCFNLNNGSCLGSEFSHSFNAAKGTNADYYLELVLENVTTVLKNGGNWYIKFGFHLESYSNYTFSNDWSYIQSSTLQKNEKITLYTDSGALIWGQEPPAK